MPAVGTGVKFTRQEVVRLDPGKAAKDWGKHPLQIAEERSEYYHFKVSEGMALAAQTNDPVLWIHYGRSVRHHYNMAVRWDEILEWMRGLGDSKLVKLEVYRNR